MSKSMRFAILPQLFLLAILLAFVVVSPVRAQDETPPVEVPTEVVPTETVPVEETPDETAPVPSSAIPEEEPSSSIPDGDQPSETPGLPGIVDSLSNYGMVLVSDLGEPLSLATQEAVDALASDSVWFKLGTVRHNFSTITDALMAIYAGDVPSDGLIYVDASYGSSTVEPLGDLQFIGADGYLPNPAAVKGLIGPSLDPFTNLPVVTINANVAVFETTGGFKVSNFYINGNSGDDDGTVDTLYGSLAFFSNTGSINLSNLVIRNANKNGTGLAIAWHTGTVNLTNVDSSYNPGGGARIDNSDGTAGITIKNSSFDNNDGDYPYANGIFITSQGSVLMDGVSVSGNQSIYEDDGYPLPAMYLGLTGPVTVKNSVFNNNLSWALANDLAVGKITLDNILANGNSRAGVSLSSTLNFSANKVHANQNGQFSYIDTCGHDYDTDTCLNTGVGNVLVTNSEFNDNTSISGGVWVRAKGSITLTNVEASRNRGEDPDTMLPSADGAKLDNDFANTGIYAVTVNSSRFDGNSENGLEVFSKGVVTLNKIKAIGDDSWGQAVYIENTSGTTAGVNFSGTTADDNEFSNYLGIFVNTNGPVVMNYVKSSAADTNAIETHSPAGNVTINNSQFYAVNYAGLYVIAKGNITLKEVNSRGYLGTTLDNHDSDTPKTVTVTGGNFGYSYVDGLSVFSKGNISINKITSSYNDGYGLYLDNVLDGSGTGNVVVNGSTINGNAQDGLWIITNGTITIGTTNATGNSGWGADLDNFDAPAAKAVTITKSVFDGNGAGGLNVLTKGAIKLTNVGASYNSTFGEFEYGDTVLEGIGPGALDHWRFEATEGDIITITMTGSIMDPYLELYDGMGALLVSDNDSGSGYNALIKDFVIPADGIYHVYASVLGGHGTYSLSIYTDPAQLVNTPILPSPAEPIRGAVLDNSGGTAGITINNSLDPDKYAFYDNASEGLVLLSKGLISLTSVNSEGSLVSNGAVINNLAGSAGVTISSSRFDLNHLNGLMIDTRGVITLTKTSASGNGNLGAWLHNDAASYSPMALTINNDLSKMGYRYNGFSENGAGGLNIASRGAVTLTNVEAYGNTGNGALIVNNTGMSDIKITNSFFDWNEDDGSGGGYGLRVTSFGSIILTKGSSSHNFLEGASLNNQLGGIFPQKPITITSFAFDDNRGYGLEVLSNGAIKVTSISASNNSGNGATLNNQTGIGGISLLVTSGKKNQFSGNGGYGLFVNSTGAVILNQVDALTNSEYGVTIFNQYDASASVTVTGGEMSGSGNLNNGLTISTKGVVLLSGVTASSNEGWGVSISAQALVSNTKTVVVNKSGFNDNGGYGLNVQSNGAITLNGVSGKGNGSEGAYLDNQTAEPVIKPAVTVLSSLAASDFSGNAGGLYIISKGAISLTGVVANDSLDQEGIHIENCVLDLGACTASGNVTLTNITARNNMLGGVKIATNGALVKLSGVVAMMNGMDDDPEPEGYSGIFIDSHNSVGLVTLVTSASMGNAKHGIHIAKAAAAPMPVLTGTVYFGNNTFGSVNITNLLIENLY